MEILITGRRVQIDEDDYEAIRRYPWTFDGRYPSTYSGKRPNRRKVRMHEFLMGPPPARTEWDHWNRDPLDNRRSNFRAVPHAVNIRNSRLQTGRRPNTSGFRGVTWDKRRRNWRAYISTGGKQYHVGHFDSLELAVMARMAAEPRVWG